MGQLGVRIINIVLFTTSCFFAAGVFNHVADSQLAPDYVAAFKPVARTAAAQPSWDERSKILDRNLFGAEVGGSKFVEEVAPPPPPPEEDAQATKLPIRLLGTLASETASLSTAVISNTRKKKHQVVRVGDTLRDFEHVTVTSIEPRRVLLNNRDIIEELLLAKSKPKAGAPAAIGRRAGRSSALERLRDRRGRSKAKRARSAQLGRNAGKRSPDKSPDEAKIQTQLQKLQGAMTKNLINDLEPAFNDNGEISGVLVGEIADDALLARAGLVEDDIIVSLNGIKIDSAGAAARVLRELAKCTPMTGLIQGASGTKTLNITQSLLAELNCTN